MVRCRICRQVVANTDMMMKGHLKRSHKMWNFADFRGQYELITPGGEDFKALSRGKPGQLKEEEREKVLEEVLQRGKQRRPHSPTEVKQHEMERERPIIPLPPPEESANLQEQRPLLSYRCAHCTFASCDWQQTLGKSSRRG